MKKVKADVAVTGGGTVYLVDGLTAKGKTWIAENLPQNAQYWGESMVVEHHYIDDIVQGMMADGLQVS